MKPNLHRWRQDAHRLSLSNAEIDSHALLYSYSREAHLHTGQRSNTLSGTHWIIDHCLVNFYSTYIAWQHPSAIFRIYKYIHMHTGDFCTRPTLYTSARHSCHWIGKLGEHIMPRVQPTQVTMQTWKSISNLLALLPGVDIWSSN